MKSGNPIYTQMAIQTSIPSQITCKTIARALVDSTDALKEC